MYGFLDESGAPGVASSGDDFLIASIVIFPDEKSAVKCSAAIDRLRVRLGKTSTYEFHRSHNSSVNQNAFLKLLPDLEFRFITVAVKKNHSRKHASYSYLAELLVQELKRRTDKMNIKMDSNPTLYSEIKKQLKLAKLRDIRVKEAKSHSDNLLQLADYVANLSSKRAKNTPKSIEWFRPIAKKQLAFIEITE